MVAFCQGHGVAVDRCGKLLVAIEERELARLNELVAHGNANGLHGLRMVEGQR